MDEYPKVIDVDGLKITATSAEDEARWREKTPNPLNDVTIEMDNPAYNEPVAPPEPEPPAATMDGPVEMPMTAPKKKRTRVAPPKKRTGKKY